MDLLYPCRYLRIQSRFDFLPVEKAKRLLQAIAFTSDGVHLQSQVLKLADGFPDCCPAYLQGLTQSSSRVELPISEYLD
jgi:hypothetical protein